MNSQVGVVVIGRNEGERLQRCLQSVVKQTKNVVYVDSGSFDGSVDFAMSMGIYVVELDVSVPFSAGRARNEGFDCLVTKCAGIKYVQFIDGDCELFDDWLIVASDFLKNHQDVAIVAGRRKERFPEESIYNLLCDIEWNTPVGEAKSCGGDFLIRIEAFRIVKGFNPIVIAGEEPELCYRLRQMGLKIYRLDYLMTIHDAAITKFSQWWSRAIRSGHAYAQGCALHGLQRERFCLRDSLRIWFWSFILPLLIGFSVIVNNSGFIVLALLYPAHVARITLKMESRLKSWKLASLYAFFIVVSRLPQLIGQLFFLKRIICQDKYLVIEYKSLK